MLILTGVGTLRIGDANKKIESGALVGMSAKYDGIAGIFLSR